LRNAGCDKAGNGEHEETPGVSGKAQATVPPRGLQPQKADARYGKLRDACEHDGVGEQCPDVPPRRRAEARDRAQGHKQDRIQCHDAGRRGSDAPLGIEQRGDDRDHPSERHIGRRNPYIVRRQCVTLAHKARREHVDHRRREHDPGDCQHANGE